MEALTISLTIENTVSTGIDTTAPFLMKSECLSVVPHISQIEITSNTTKEAMKAYVATFLVKESMAIIPCCDTKLKNPFPKQQKMEIPNRNNMLIPKPSSLSGNSQCPK